MYFRYIKRLGWRSHISGSYLYEQYYVYVFTHIVHVLCALDTAMSNGNNVFGAELYGGNSGIFCNLTLLLNMLVHEFELTSHDWPTCIYVCMYVNYYNWDLYYYVVLVFHVYCCLCRISHVPNGPSAKFLVENGQL